MNGLRKGLSCAAILVAVDATPAPAQDGSLRSGAERSEVVETWSAPPVDLERLLEEDAEFAGDTRRPYRVGVPLPTSLTPGTSGSWTRDGSGRWTWRLTVHSEGARWLVLGFDRFRLVDGAQLWVGDPSGRTRIGPRVASDAIDGELWFPPIEGDTVVVELDWPTSLMRPEPDLRLATVSHGYRPIQGEADFEALGGTPTGECEIDVNCPLGDDWQDEKRGVVRILIEGAAFCTGSLINNTTLDCTPYVLTADHCFPPGTSMASLTFLFNYDRPACEPGSAPPVQTLTGAITRFAYAPSDARLLEVVASPPASFDVYFNGWNRLPTPASQSFAIHHPFGDYKKISHDADPLVNGVSHPGTHWRVTQWEQGVTEPGSSGAPLLDPTGRIVGQLDGGNSACIGPDPNGGSDEFGRLHVSWTEGLSSWLDPLDAAPNALPGMDQSFCAGPAPRLEYASHEVPATCAPLLPGYTVPMTVAVRNTGPLPATGDVTALLSDDQPTVEVLRPEAAFDPIAAGQVVSSDPPHYSVAIDAAHPCGETVLLELNAESVEGSWASQFRVPTGSIVGSMEPFFDDMESGNAGWTVENLAGSTPWEQQNIASFSPVTAWRAPNQGSVQDSVLKAPLLGDLAPGARLRFQHMLSTGSGDGGVLEYSVDGLSWLDAGEMIVAGPYNTLLPTGLGSPLGGRLAWSGGVFGEWREVEVDLAELEGRDVRLRWRFGADVSGGGIGWFLDDVRLEAPVFDCTIAGCDGDCDGHCASPEGSDCDDANPAVFPGAPQICDLLNNDCNDPLWPSLPPDETLDDDGDGLTNACDVCPLVSDPAQSDGDGDGDGDMCDGDDGLIFIRFDTEDELAWWPEDGVESWNVYQGDLDVLRAAGTYTQEPGSNPLAARQCGLLGTTWSGVGTPGPGQVAFLLVTDVVADVEGSLGNDSSGDPRTNDHPCP